MVAKERLVWEQLMNGSRPVHRARRVGGAMLLVACIVLLEWQSRLGYSLGVLYVLPVAVVGTLGRRGYVVAAAIACGWIRGFFTDFAGIEYWLRFAMAVLAYSGVGLLVAEMTRNRRKLLAAFADVRLEKERRHLAEDQLRMLAYSSPAAIVTLDRDAKVLFANRAAHELLGFGDSEDLVGKRVDDNLPVFAQALALGETGAPMRITTTSWARRASGVQFPMVTWFSTYGEGGARCLAGIFVDVSEEVRDRELESFRHFTDYNRLLAGAVSHEIRNLCSAISVVTANLARHEAILNDADFRALSTLVESLGQIASANLRSSKEQSPEWVKLSVVLEQLRLVIEPDWSELGADIEWSQDDAVVQAEEHGLLQVFLNLTQNALRAVEREARPSLHIKTSRHAGRVVVSVIDNGPGVRDASILFQPFRPGAEGTGLGLFVSRQIMLAFNGSITHVPTSTGCRFDVSLVAEPVALLESA